MNYQEEYYKKLLKEEIVKEEVFKELDRMNRNKFHENGSENESLEDRGTRINWYYETRIDIESSSIQELYKRYINNRGFSDKKYFEKLDIRLYSIEHGLLKTFVDQYSSWLLGYSVRIKDEGDLKIISFGYDVQGELSKEIKDNLFKLNKDDRVSYIKNILLEISNIFSSNPSKNTKQTEGISFSVTRKYIRFFNKLRETTSIFNINLDKIIKGLKLEKTLYRQYGKFDNFIEEDSIQDAEYMGISEINTKMYVNKSFTASRQVIAIKHLLHTLNIDSLNTDKVRIASFMQFLTGRQPDLQAKDTTLYKLIDNRKQEETKRQEDVEFVANQFDYLGLKDLADKMRKEI